MTIIDADAQKVFVRFQIPRDKQHPEPARVANLHWTANKGEVTAAYRNFHNTGGNNIMLWMEFNIWALQYAGLFSHPNLLHVEPQLGLNQTEVVVSFILPSGTEKLEKIYPTIGHDWSEPDKAAAHYVFGLKGNLDIHDYAYSSNYTLKNAIQTYKNGNARTAPKLHLACATPGGGNLFVDLKLMR
ncbi:hypothetical protein ETB97_000854 [Aspergillus alliaceus]|uniref:Uncharacterized protein n=1 Tax=Petromyces alliaceus TaxID=209559 RepID=A0A8H6A6B3_PETAA|nr:hypothetical protein ETB97_000854 [Aspergillus burnettii]